MPLARFEFKVVGKGSRKPGERQYVGYTECPAGVEPQAAAETRVAQHLERGPWSAAWVKTAVKSDALVVPPGVKVLSVTESKEDALKDEALFLLWKCELPYDNGKGGVLRGAFHLLPTCPLEDRAALAVLKSGAMKLAKGKLAKSGASSEDAQKLADARSWLVAQAKPGTRLARHLGGLCFKCGEKHHVAEHGWPKAEPKAEAKAKPKPKAKPKAKAKRTGKNQKSGATRRSEEATSRKWVGHKSKSLISRAKVASRGITKK